MLPVLASSKFFAFRTEVNGKYLQSVYREDGGSRIEASAGTIIADPRAWFFVEPSRKGGFLHVRSCYNNKYWVPVQDSGRWIIGTADEPKDDMSKPTSCTLFQALPVKDNDNSIRFLHCGLQKFACVVSIGAKTYMQLDDGDDHGNKCDNFTVSFPQELPKHVAFKGINDKYLSIRACTMVMTQLSMVVLQKNIRFQMREIKDARAIFTTFANADGSVRIMSSTGGFLRRFTDNTIQLVQEDDNDPNSWFEVVTGDGFVALRNLGNNKFCRSISPGDVLSACDDSISQWSKLKLEVPVKESEISVVKFHLDEARIYNKEPTNAVTITRNNKTSREVKATFSFAKKVEMVSTWETKVSLKRGQKSIFNLGPLTPTSREATVSLSKTTSEKSMDEVTVIEEYYIPPGTKVAGTFHAMRASRDVPYSYKQTDVLTTGEEVITIHDDGIYTIANNYDLHFTVTDDEEEIRKLGG
ncbi:uncharacterized protein [Lolium perenne]|uniref:uncharacterized protein n=1 Tax=Lolium perenne TaxID=4522 RepID=UPI0021F5A000|nr:uncharacterized protein LOC127309828 [Lolium perenne]